MTCVLHTAGISNVEKHHMCKLQIMQMVNKENFNPLAPVPAVAGRAKTTPKIPVPAVAGLKKHVSTNALSLPP